MFKIISNNNVKETITGFTLAEVLITLTIIGVIAALTIPALITGIQDAQYKTAWKKSYSELAQSANRLKMDNGGTLNGLFQNTSDIILKFAPYFSVAKICLGSSGNCWHNANAWYSKDGTPRNSGNLPGMVLGNGNLVLLAFQAQDCSSTVEGGGNMPICGYIFEDINGYKGPNIIGTDIFVSWITQNGVSPAGYHDNYVNICRNTGTNSGYGCAAMYLLQ